MPKVQESKTLKFCLLGQCDCPNPSAISRDEIALWEKQGIITYLGETDDVRPFIESASCVVLPSFYKEGIPRVLLEAMSMGKPIITTNTSGCKECIVPPLKAYKNLLIGQNGILIPPKDAESLSLALSLLTPRKLMQMGAKAREFVVNRFCITRVINYYTSHIYSLLQSHKTNPIQTKSPNTNPILAFVSNTCFSMYNFRLKVLQSLKKSGFTIHIIAPFDSSTPKLQEEGFFMHHLYIDSRSLNPFKDLRTIAMLYKLFKQISPALVFNYTIKPAIYSSSVCNLLKIPNIAIITGLGYVFINDKGDTSSLKKTILRFIVCKMYQFALKNTQEVWFLNNDDKQEFLHYKLITQAKAFLLDSEGVDTEYFSPKFCKNRQSIKRRQDDEIIFLLIARMLWDKGVGEFVQAAQMLQDSIKTQDSYSNNGGGGIIKLRFYLLGKCDCPNPSAISRDEIALWEKQGIITYLGETDDVRPFIESASCVVLPSFREGVSVSLLESMAMGKPIITSNVSGCRHLVRDFANAYPNGFLCESRDALSLANAMQKFIALNEAQKKQMGQNARKLACESYSIQRIIDIYHKTCVSLLPRE